MVSLRSRYSNSYLKWEGLQLPGKTAWQADGWRTIKQEAQLSLLSLSPYPIQHHTYGGSLLFLQRPGQLTENYTLPCLQQTNTSQSVVPLLTTLSQPTPLEEATYSTRVQVNILNPDNTAPPPSLTQHHCNSPKSLLYLSAYLIPKYWETPSTSLEGRPGSWTPETRTKP